MTLDPKRLEDAIDTAWKRIESAKIKLYHTNYTHSEIKELVTDAHSAMRPAWDAFKDLEAQLASANARIAEPEAARQWRDISTAPKDGRPILVAGGTVEWRMDYQRGTQSSGEQGGWFSHSAQRFLGWHPTHYLPLPTPPAQGADHES